MQKTVSLNYFWRRSLPNFKFNCIVLRTCLRMPMHRNWTGVLSTHFHFEMAEGCRRRIATLAEKIKLIWKNFSFLISGVFRNNIFEWDCDICTEEIDAFADYMTSDIASNGMVNYLSGKIFCEDPQLGFSEEQINACQSYVSGFIPTALKSLFSGRSFPAEDVCADLYFICESNDSVFWWS